MAGVSVDAGSKGGRKSVDSNVNMVPMIDLLISVIAFLLMTAVWVQTGALQSRQPNTAPSPDPPPPAEHLVVAINQSGVRVGDDAATAREIAAGPRQMDELREALAQAHRVGDPHREIWVQPESSVPYDTVMHVMDAVYEAWTPATRAPGQSRAALANVRVM